MPEHKISSMSWGENQLELGGKTLVMGILNVTPDSFSDGGKFFDPKRALSHAEQMIEDGADILDIGGESTRPFSDPVAEEEEIRRTIPIIETLAKHIRIPISIDTTKAAVARQALLAGASIINDISALRSDARMVDVAAEFKVPVILMHMLGTPKTMQENPEYDNLIRDITLFLQERIEFARTHGIPGSRIIIDPGIGFGKTFDHNFQLIKNFDFFKSLNTPILIGPSRKAFIRNALGAMKEQALQPDNPLVETGTQAAVAAAALKGADIVRCHNVLQTRATLNIIDAIKNA